jgi:putative oxidoreductase
MKGNRFGFDLGLFVLRLAIGVIFIAHGAQKIRLFGGDLQQTISGFEAMGIPPILTYCSIAAELGGGILMILGFLGRFAAFAGAVNMGVAIAKVHIHNGLFNQNQGFEFPMAVGAIALALLFIGMGGFSIDAKLASKMDKVIGKNAT